MIWRAAYIYIFFLAACSPPTQDFDSRLVPIGNFRLGQIVTRTDAGLTKGPLSRSASSEEWIAAVNVAFQDRFSRFGGGSYYHLGITANGYILAKKPLGILQTLGNLRRTRMDIFFQQTVEQSIVISKIPVVG